MTRPTSTSPGAGPGRRSTKPAAGAAGAERPHPARDPSGRSGALQWALHAGDDPAMAAADWLAGDVAPGRGGALALLSDPQTPVEALRAAKEAFKTMRVMGEQVADRRLGARLYLGAIASALAFHEVRISSQSDEALLSALLEMRDDHGVPEPLRHLAAVALRRLRAK